MKAPCLPIGALLMVVAVAGCRLGWSGSAPTFYVTGKVVFKDGSPCSGGLIEFRSTTSSRLALSVIAADGSFSLYTIHENKQVPGTFEGPYRVTVTPPGRADPKTGAAPPSIDLPEIYTVQRAGSNEFTVRL